MVIVLIHWRIKPTDEAIEEFITFWQTKVPIKDKSGLVGEFLSKPYPAESISFKVDDLSPKEGEKPYISFVNVGMWKDLESFHQQVGQNFNDDQPPRKFEQYRRTRTILTPETWRIGAFALPNKSSFEESE
jgi:hypothetical protein